MTNLSVNDMIAQINKNYLLKAYLYEVRIYGGGNPIEDAKPEVMINCSSVNVPGANIQYNQQKKYGVGLTTNVPMGRSFTELNLTFYETEREQERKYFTDWQARMFNKQTNRFGYYKDNVKTISILQMNKQGEVTYECKILEAFPSNISPLDKSYSHEGISQFNVTMQFYQIEETSSPNKRVR